MPTRTESVKGRWEVRMCMGLSLNIGQTVWLDVSAEKFAAIPEVEVLYSE
jgi:hypothetical protein